jgi:hypothetical protein
MYNPADASNPPPAPAPPPAPSPQEAGEPPVAPRYQYLVSRLRNRQITMEEATELFAIQRQQVAALIARTNALAAAAASPSMVPRVSRPVARPMTPPPPTAATGLESLDPWGEGLIFLALGAGLFAALLKRATGPAPAKGSPSSRPASGSPKS